MAATDTNILNIVGEQVTLRSTIFPLTENFFVNFDPYYKFSGITPEQEETLKKALQTVFHKGSIFNNFAAPSTSDISGNTGLIGKIINKISPKTPLPPCSQTEKDLIVKSLTHRFGILRAQVFQEKEKDSVRFRELTEHAYRLRDFIDYFKNTKDCKDYEVEALDKVGTLDDDRIKILLQQFIFLVLQGQNPLKEYKNVGSIKAPGFIRDLEKKPLDTEAFKKFIADYQEKQLPVNPRIAKVLEVTELDLNAIQYQINTALQSKINEIIEDIKDLIPDLNSPFWQGLDMTDLTAVFDRLLEHMKEREYDIEKLRKELDRKTREYNACQASIQEKEQEKSDLSARITNLQTELDAANTTARSRNTNSAGFQAAVATAQKEIDGLKVNIITLQQQVQSLQTQYQEASAQVIQLESVISTKQSEIDTLKEKVSECESLRTENEALKSQLAELRTKSEAVDAAQGNLDSVKQELSAARQRVSELEGMVESNRSAHAEEKAALESTISELREQLSQCGDKEEINDLKKKLSDTQKTLEDLQASAATNAGQRLTLEQEKAELTSRIGELAQQAAKCNSELSELKKECDETKQRLVAAMEQIEGLQLQLHDSQDASRKYEQENENIEGVIRNIAAWIRSGATEAPPTLNMESTSESKLVSIIDAVNELASSRSTSQTKSQTEFAIKRNYCYLLFFSSYMIARNFTNVSLEGEDAEKKTMILSVINATLYGKEIAKGQYDPLGVYKKMQKKISAEKGDSRKLVLDCLVRILDVMERIYISRQTGVYELDYFALDSTELSILQILEEESTIAISKIVSRAAGATSPYKAFFTKTIESYWNQYNNPSSAYSMYLKTNMDIHGDTINNNSITVVYGAEGESIKAKAYSANDELNATLEGSFEGEYLTGGEQEKIRQAKGFSYAFVFYVYLFVVRDFLDSKSGEIADTCPLPQVLKKI